MGDPKCTRGLGADLLHEPVAPAGATGRRGCSGKGSASQRGTCGDPHRGEGRDSVFSPQTQRRPWGAGAAHAPRCVSTSVSPRQVRTSRQRPYVHVLASASAPRAALRGGGCERAGRGASEALTYQSGEGGHLRRRELGGSQAGVGVSPTHPPPPWAGILPRVSMWLRDPKAPRPAALPLAGCVALEKLLGPLGSSSVTQ